MLYIFYSILFLAAIMTISVSSSQAAIRTEDVEYKDGNDVLQGYIAYDDAVKGTRPVVIVVHEWWGLNDYAKSRCRQLAQMGYLAFAADIYGKGIRPKNMDEAKQQAGIYRANNTLLRSRIKTALEKALQNPMADNKRVAVIGYCFGGGVALELARSGADIQGVVSFHGSIKSQNPADAKNIKCKVLVLHGANDPAVTIDDVLAFEKEMRESSVEWEVDVYSSAVHAFTNPASGNDPSKGSAYNAEADRKSWRAMQEFFKDIFSKK